MPVEQEMCPGCGAIMEKPDMSKQIMLENQYREDYGEDALNDNVKRVMLCADCVAKLQAMKEQSSADV